MARTWPLVWPNDYKVVEVAQVVVGLYLLLHKSVEGRQGHIARILAWACAKWYAAAVGGKLFEGLHVGTDKLAVLEQPGERPLQQLVADVGVVVLYVALCVPQTLLWALAQPLLHLQGSRHLPITLSRRISVANERPFDAFMTYLYKALVPLVAGVKVQFAYVAHLLTVFYQHVVIFARGHLARYDALLHVHKVFYPLLFVLSHTIVVLALGGYAVGLFQHVPLPCAVVNVSLSFGHISGGGE